MERKNCWEYASCGREPGGVYADEHGVCPAAIETRLDGIHGGVNAGRSCWTVAGTLSGDPPACSCMNETGCYHCQFYRSVLSDESPHLVFTPAIMSLLETERSNEGWLRGTVE